MNIAEPLLMLKNLEDRQIITTRYDIDRHIKLETIRKIGLLLGQPENQLLSMCLFPKNKNSKTKINIEGTRYCPFCLQEDGAQPFFRFHWRLNFITVCNKHKCYLEEKCPNCGSLIQYWKTKFNQSIIQCFKCGENIINVKNQVKNISAVFTENDTFKIFQYSLLNIYKQEEWKGKYIEKEEFFRKLWKLAWAENIKSFENSVKNYKSWEEYLKNTIISTERTFKAIFKAFNTIKTNPNRLEKPFVCSIDGKTFSVLVYYLRHLHTHKKLKCPLDECGCNTTTIYNENYKCLKCGTEFLANGEMIKRGKKVICPLEECKSTSIRIRKNDYRCAICGTTFLKDGEIKYKGKKQKCPLKECRSINTRAYYKNFKCFTCGTEFKEDGEIIKAGKRVQCPIRYCESDEIRIRNNGFKCEKCGSYLDEEGNLLERGSRFKYICPLKNCGSKLIRPYENNLLCHRCGTIFLINREIIKKGKYKTCPLNECGSSRIRINKNQQNIFLCQKCGTKFSNSGNIIKKGKIVKCPSITCESMKTRADVNNYTCERCRTKFTIDGKILELGIPLKCPQKNCGSQQIYVRKRKLNNICKLCGTEFLANGKIIRKRKNIICPLCKSRNTRYKIQNGITDEYYCYKCGTEFTNNSKIIIKGYTKQCSKCGSKRTQIRLTKEGFKCRTCGTEFV